MKAGYLFLASIIGTLCIIGSPAQAATVETPMLDFRVSDQSLWGGGPAASLAYSGSTSVAGIDFGYNFGASTGTVSADITGSLRAEYPEELAAPGNASVDLAFLGNPGGGQWTSDLGIWARLTAASINLLNEDYALNLRADFTPALATPTADSDSFSVEVPAFNYTVFEAGAGFRVEQNSMLTGLGVDGLLNYQRRGDASTYQTPFSLEVGGMSVTAALTTPGTWDFWATELDLRNMFYTNFDLGLFMYESHPEITWSYIWGIPYPSGIGMTTNGFEFAEIDLFSVSPFALDFNTVSLNDPLFSINVAAASGTAPVPEPSTMLLLGSGLAGLAGYGRRRFKK